MKWLYWLVLELLIIFGVMAWIYFFPSEIECDFAKGMIGFVLIYTIEDCKDIRRMKTMDYKEGMTCGECLKYEFCPIANHNTNHKACMKITTKDNYTIEQDAGENTIEGGVVSISGTVKNEEAIEHRTYEQGLYDGYRKGFNEAYEQTKSVISSNIPSLVIKVESCDIETMLKVLKDKGVIKSWYYNGTYHAV